MKKKKRRKQQGNYLSATSLWYAKQPG